MVYRDNYSSEWQEDDRNISQSQYRQSLEVLDIN